MATHSLPKRFYLPPLSRGQPLAGEVSMAVEWRAIEVALVEIAKAMGEDYRIEHSPNTGDSYISIYANDADLTRINATELAKELAERLK